MRIVRTLSLILLLFISFDSKSKNEYLLTQLDSESIDLRSKASQRIYGAGISNDKVYKKLETILLEVSNNLPKKSPRSDEIAWHLKALSSSGDKKYLSIMETFIQSKNRKVAKYAKKSKKELLEVAATGKPLLHYSKVLVITDNQAERCTFLDQRSCETSRSAEKCVDHHKNNAVQIGGNAILILHSDSHYGVGIAPWGENTTMKANYYKCND